MTGDVNRTATCIYCDPTQNLFGTKTSPLAIYYCVKCGNNVVEFECGCGSQRAVGKPQEQATEFSCGELEPANSATISCGQRYSWSTCPSCLTKLTVFEPSKDQSLETQDRDDQALTDFDDFQCYCTHCFALTQLGDCDQCGLERRLTKVTADGHQYCASCSPAITEPVGQHQSSERPAVKEMTEAVTNEAQDETPLSLHTIRVQIDTLNETLDQFANLQPHVNDGTIWSILPRLHLKANDLRMKLTALESLPAEVIRIQEELAIFRSELSEREANTSDRDAIVQDSVLGAISQIGEKLAGNEDRVARLDNVIRKSHNTIFVATQNVQQTVSEIKERLSMFESSSSQIDESLHHLDRRFHHELEAVPARTLEAWKVEEQKARQQLEVELARMRDTNHVSSEKIQHTVDLIAKQFETAVKSSLQTSGSVASFQKKLHDDLQLIPERALEVWKRERINERIDEHKASQEAEERQRLLTSSIQSLITAMQTKLIELDGRQSSVLAQQISHFRTLKTEIDKLVKGLAPKGSPASTGFSTKALLTRMGISTGEEETAAPAVPEVPAPSPAPAPIGPTLVEIQDLLDQFQNSNTTNRLLNCLKKIPDLFDEVEKEVQSHDSQRNTFEKFQSGLQNLIDTWQHYSRIERLPTRDITRVLEQFDPLWHTCVSQELVQDPQLHGTLAQVTKPGYRLLTETADPIRLRRAEVVVRYHATQPPQQTGDDG